MSGNYDTNDKFVTMIGFAKRAGKIVYGYDNLKSARNVKLFAVSSTASDNLRQAMRGLSEQKGIALVTAPELESVVGNNVKALGLTDANMAKAAEDHARQSGNVYTTD